VFNFLAISTQTEIAQAEGRKDNERVRHVGSLALALAAAIGMIIIVLGIPGTPFIAKLMEAQGPVFDEASAYLQVRFFGAPAVLLMLVSFGILRGLQDMRTPLWIAVSINVLNIILDAILIFGYGPLPALGVAGAALASAISQWAGSIWAVASVFYKVGFARYIDLGNIRKLLEAGRDLFVRTGLLTVFLLLTTRAATGIGPEAGAAHQAIRQVWVFTALFLDAFAITGQSLVGFFFGPRNYGEARRVAFIVCLWSLVTGMGLSVVMWLGQGIVVELLVPLSAVPVFAPAWVAAATAQPLNALAFATDGIHWGTGDFRFLRNAMVAATGLGGVAVLLVNKSFSQALTWIWVITGLWIAIRAGFGLARIWPGIGQSPLRS
jgi:MATE family multidrug resistance protein